MTKENIHDSLAVAKSEYSKANKCEKVFLSALYYYFFDVVFCMDVFEPTDERCIPMHYFNKEDQAFLKEIEKLGSQAITNDSHKLVQQYCQANEKASNE